MEKKKILRELTRGVHMPIFCDEEGRCDAIEDCTTIDANECSCCDINHIVRAFNGGIEFQKQKSPWIDVEDDLPCNHEEMYKMSGSLLYTEEVLVLAGNVLLAGRKLVTCMLFDDNTGKWKWDTLLHVKYWMRIPKSPK